MSEPRVELSGEITAGVDSNPAQSRDATELSFAQVSFDAAREQALGKTTALTLGLSGWYRDYEASNDSYRLTLSGDWSRETADGLGLLTLTLSGSAYRDALVPADERDELALRLRYNHTLTARDTLTISAQMRGLAYRNASLPWSGRPGSSTRSQSSRRTEHARDGVAVRRDDRLGTLGIDLAHHWMPTLTTQLSLTYTSNHSPVAAEAYTRRGAGLLLRLEPAEPWQLDIGVGWSRTQYERAIKHQNREDTQRNAGIAVRRRLQHRELYCSLDWIDSDSTLDARSFWQRVTQCGLAWSF